MLTSRLLQSLLTPRASRFLFLSRHPIAVAMAHRKWRACASMSISSLVLHWVVSHRVLMSDLPHLRAARVLRYEDLVEWPRACINAVFDWVALPRDSDDERGSRLVETVERHANRKYEQEYCTSHLSTLEQARRHCEMANALRPTLSSLRLGYHLIDADVGSDFACIDARVKAHLGPSGCKDVPTDGNFTSALISAHADIVLKAEMDGKTTRPRGRGIAYSFCGASPGGDSRRSMDGGHGAT
jgi:hypothetical protein